MRLFVLPTKLFNSLLFLLIPPGCSIYAASLSHPFIVHCFTICRCFDSFYGQISLSDDETKYPYRAGLPTLTSVKLVDGN